MTDIDELKRFALLHARAQGIAGTAAILDRIHDDESWTGRWFEAGERLLAEGRLLPAVRHYMMARFPYVDGPARQEALDRCVTTFGR
jgi:esterase FrsA